MRWAWIAAVALFWSSQRAYGQASQCGDGVVQSPEICDDGLHGQGFCPANCGLSDPNVREEAADALNELPPTPPADESTAPAPTPPTIYVPPPRYELRLTAESSGDQPQIRPARAFGLSLVSTLLLGGTIPNLGHLYAGETKRAYTSWGIRMGGVTAVLVGGAFAFNDFFEGPDDEDGRSFCSDGLLTRCRGGTFVRAGVVSVFATTLYDLIDAPFAAANARKKGVRPWSNNRPFRLVGAPNGVGAAVSF